VRAAAPAPVQARLLAAEVAPPPSIACRSKRDALEAWHDWERLERDAGRKVRPSVGRVFRAAIEMAYEHSRFRVGRGAIEVWYFDVYAKAGLKRSAGTHAMQYLRRAGFLFGEPCEPDYEHDCERERARYEVRVPAACSRLIHRIRSRAQARAREIAAAIVAAREADKPSPNDACADTRSRAGITNSKKIHPFGIMQDLSQHTRDGPDGAPPTPTYPDDYLEARIRRSAPKGPYPACPP
jgi:hypothetical protein